MPSIQQNPIQATENTIHNNRESVLEKSWREINLINQNIITLYSNNASIQPATFHQKEVLTEQHFKNHPIGKSTAIFYKNRLANFFNQENQIIQIQKEQRNNPLRLVN
jgi:hypothetical protein